MALILLVGSFVAIAYGRTSSANATGATTPRFGYIAGEANQNQVGLDEPNFLVTNDGGATWTDLRSSLAAGHIGPFSNPSIDWNSDIETVSAIDSAVWINGVYYNASDSADPNNLKSGVAYSKDGGSTWNWSFPGGGTIDIASVSMFDATHGFALSDFVQSTADPTPLASPQLFYTTDGGKTWTSGLSLDAVRNPKTCSYYSPPQSDVETVTAISSTAAVITDCGEMFWTSDAGATATSVLLPDTSNGMKDASIGPDGFGYTIGETNQIFKTTDFGHSWTVASTASDVANFHGVSLIPGTHNAFIVGDNLTAATNYASGDGGVAVDLISSEGTTITALPPAFKGLYVEGLQGVQALTACDVWSVGQETNTDRNPTPADVAIVAHSTDCGQSWNRVSMPGDVGKQTSLNKVVFAKVTPTTVVTTTTVHHAHKTTIRCVKGKIHKRVTAVHPRCPRGYKKG